MELIARGRAADRTEAVVNFSRGGGGWVRQTAGGLPGTLPDQATVTSHSVTDPDPAYLPGQGRCQECVQERNRRPFFTVTPRLDVIRLSKLCAHDTVIPPSVGCLPAASASADFPAVKFVTPFTDARFGASSAPLCPFWELPDSTPTPSPSPAPRNCCGDS